MLERSVMVFPYRRFFFILLFVLLPLGESFAQEDPSAIFLRAYTEFQNGERLERDGDPASAVTKFRQAADLLELVSREAPEWQPMVVKFRLRRILEAIDRLEGAGVQAAPPAELFPEGSLPQPDLPPFPGTTTQQQPARPVPGTPLQPLPPSPSEATAQSREIERLRAQNEKLGAELKSALREVDRTRVSVVELRHELAVAKSALENVKGDGEDSAKIREEAAAKIAALAGELEELRAEKTVLEEENNRLLTKLEQAAEYISSSDSIRETLDQERREFASERDAMQADRDKISEELKGALSELESSRERLGEIEKLATENEALQAQVSAGQADLAAAKDELAEAEKKLANVVDAEEIARNTQAKERKIAELEAQKDALTEQNVSDLAAMRAEMEVLLREKEAATVQAEERLLKIAEISTQNEELLERIRLNAEQLESAEAVASQNNALQTQLEESQAKLEELQKAQESGEATPASDEQLMTLRSELNSLNDRLLGLRMELSARDSRIAELETQLDETAGNLAEMRLNPEASEAEKEMMAENELLRGIIMRQLREQARRDQAKRLIQEEIDRLAVKSDTVSQQLEVLSRPVELTEAERAIFRTPMTLAEESSDGALQMGIAVTKPPESEEEKPAADQPGAPTGQGMDSLPKPMRDLAVEAQAAFEQGDLVTAEKYFQTIVDSLPDNHYGLSRLAVVQFDSGKNRAAEVALEKALTIQPNDPFSNAILGIVYFKQGKIEQGEKQLRKALEADPTSARNWNYLGIILSEKGDSKGAEESLQKALSLEPRYAEGHFNMAVVYATQTPPSIELAKQHYSTAIQLGAEPDRALERVFQQQSLPPPGSDAP